jgi:hypothetical protein
MPFVFDEGAIRFDAPSDFVRFLGSDFLSSTFEVLIVQAGWRCRPYGLDLQSVRGQMNHIP